MKTGKIIALTLTLAAAGLVIGNATERLFTYTYEPETMPKGVFEFEQWLTARLGRNATVGQQAYQRWEFREEFEYGLTDHYTVSLYVNHDYETFKDPATGAGHSTYDWTGISLENKYLVWNPADHPVGLTLYLEPTYDGKNFELEQKIILGQRHGNWKWALNLVHATEWTEDFRATEGEVELDFGLAYQFNPRWAVGLELRDHNELPEYNTWENTALYLGPVVSYRRENWWATLTVMPQVLGVNFTGNVDGNHALELEGHERWNIRLIAGFSF